jgi:hypothetical protein
MPGMYGTFVNSNPEAAKEYYGSKFEYANEAEKEEIHFSKRLIFR